MISIGILLYLIISALGLAVLSSLLLPATGQFPYKCRDRCLPSPSKILLSLHTLYTFLKQFAFTWMHIRSCRYQPHQHPLRPHDLARTYVLCLPCLVRWLYVAGVS